MQLSPHFTLEEATFSETAERKGLDNTPGKQVMINMTKTAEHMEKVRDALGGRSIYVSSWYRSPAVNTAVGGSATSGHMQGWCVDFKCRSFGTPLEIIKELIKKGVRFDQVIQEGTWVHISFDPRMRGTVLTAIFHANGKVTYKNGL